MPGRSPRIQVTPVLMIWTIICFAITYFVLRKYAFGPIQQMIDTRRERIEQAIGEADNARQQARALLEEHQSGRRNNYWLLYSLLMLEMWFRDWEQPRRRPTKLLETVS